MTTTAIENLHPKGTGWSPSLRSAFWVAQALVLPALLRSRRTS